MERGEVDLGSEPARCELTGALKAAVGARDDAQLRLLHRFARGLRFFLNVEEGVCADMSRCMPRQAAGTLAFAITPTVTCTLTVTLTLTLIRTLTPIPTPIPTPTLTPTLTRLMTLQSAASGQLLMRAGALVRGRGLAVTLTPTTPRP